MFHVIMNNSFILYKQQPGKHNTRLINFRDSVINNLIYNHLSKIVTPTQKSQKRELRVIYFFSSKKQNIDRLGKGVPFVQKIKKREETTYYCDECPNKPGLCLYT